VPTITFYEDINNSHKGQCVICRTKDVDTWPVIAYYKNELQDSYIIKRQVICKECLPQLRECEQCHELFLCNDSLMDIFVDDGILNICRECYNDLFIQCRYCHRAIRVGSEAVYSLQSLRPHEQYQQDCFDENTSICQQCYDDGKWLIHEYSYVPNLTFYKTNNDKKNLLYYGIELEVERNKQKLINILTKIPEFIYVKNDSSINDGFELVSHPATFNWLMDNKQQWNNLLTLLLKNCAADETTSCGMHIHMSLAAFLPLHLSKFMEFIYLNSDFTHFISQRAKRNLQRWASINSSKKECKKQIYYKAKYKQECVDRHTAVTIARGVTVEVRIFKGTIIPIIFWKNIEFCDALFYYTKDIGHKDLSIFGFQQYIGKYHKRYPNLYEFIKHDKVNIYIG